MKSMSIVVSLVAIGLGVLWAQPDPDFPPTLGAQGHLSNLIWNVTEGGNAEACGLEEWDLVFREYYSRHICRLDPWPEPVSRCFQHLNQTVYEHMQGPSEMTPGGILKDWSIWDRLGEIEVPTLTIGARYDTMRPAEMEEMSRLVANGRHLFCPEGSHLCMWDDQEVFMEGVIRFILDVESGSSP